MILSDGTTSINYFEEFPTDVKSVGLCLSGGLDSALTFYCLLKTLSDRNQDTLVYTMHGYDTFRSVARSYESADAVYEYIVSHFNIEVPPLHTFAFCKNKPVGKYEWFFPNYTYLKNKYNIVDIIMGDTLGMPHLNRPVWNNDVNDPTEQEIIEMSKQHPLRFPFATVNKKFIAHQYRILGLRNLSTLTTSCAADKIGPCKECWWCEERKWAFNSYDGEDSNWFDW